MGFSKSFFNQLGRDTGRAVSNALYKDKHAIVYRRAGDTSKREAAKEELKLHKQKLELEQEEREQRQLEIRLTKLSKEITQKIEQIEQIEIPEDNPALIRVLNDLTYLLKANSWKMCVNGEEAEESLYNRYADTILAKYEHALITLETYSPTDLNLPRYQQQLKVFRRNRFWGKYKFYILAITAVLCFPLFGYILDLLDT